LAAPAAPAKSVAIVPEPSTPLEEALFEVKRVVVGQGRMLERILVCLIAEGHCLLEGVPGIAKTLSVETLSKVVGGSFVRLQFTPDMLPADIVGTRIWRASTESFDIELGPLSANMVLADEINRAPAKVQSALLEAMAERQVSIGGTTFKLPRPFIVLATQNPIESEGVYPLPEAQRDRFLMKIVIDYPTPSEEVEIVQRMGVNPPEASQVLDLDELTGLQERARNVYVDRNVVDYAVSLTLATRDPNAYGLADLAPMISYGASPRASLGLVSAARRSPSSATATTCFPRTSSTSPPRSCAIDWSCPMRHSLATSPQIMSWPESWRRFPRLESLHRRNQPTDPALRVRHH